MTREKYRKDITNERFGRLVALYKIGKTKTGLGIWHCKCDFSRLNNGFYVEYFGGDIE